MGKVLTEAQKDALQQLFSPWVMRTAWNKVQTWYRTGELNDPAEYLAWQADPQGQLQSLADDLITGEYETQPFPMVPYPKKGDRTRHYTMPTVRDQVAFMAFMVLLGPFLEARMLNVSFGNRLYRSRIRHKEKWYRTPFTMSSDGVYEPFSRSYGLFRSHLQHLASDAVRDPAKKQRPKPVADGDDDSSQSDPIKEADPYQLPYQHAFSGGDLIYARLDMSLAFPSTDRGRLRNALRQSVRTQRLGEDWEKWHWGRPSFPTLRHPDQDNINPPFQNWLEQSRMWKTGRKTYEIPGQPWSKLVDQQSHRELLADYLGELIEFVVYVPWEEPAWDSDVGNPSRFVPESMRVQATDSVKEADQKREDAAAFDSHGLWPVDCNLPEEHLKRHAFGIPTGLAISGWLLNVALTGVDQVMTEFHVQLHEEAKGQRFFYIRFVDDIALFATNPDVLEEGLRRLRRSLIKTSPHFRLGWAKAQPDSVQAFLKESDEAVRRGEPEIGVRLYTKAEDYISRANVRQFITKMAEDISELAEESAEEGFGSAGVDRLDALIELAQRQDEDSEVGADARLSFAVGKMARAAWPDPDEIVIQNGVSRSSRAYVQDVFRAAETAIQNHPWRFKLWRSVIIIALRAYLYGEKDWLCDRVLPLIRWDGRVGERQRPSWEQGEAVDPVSLRIPRNMTETEQANWRLADNRRRQNRRLRVSFHRAYFWRQWAACTRALSRVEQGDVTATTGSWLSHFSPTQAKGALETVGSFESAAAAMYGAINRNYWIDSGKRPFLWWWEGEAIRAALIAARYPTLELLGELGAPKTYSLRSVHLEQVAQLIIPQMRRGLGQIYRAIRHIKGIQGLWPSVTGSPLFGVDRLAILWASQFLTTPSVFKALVNSARIKGLTPRGAADALHWAAVARSGLWEVWTPPQELDQGFDVPTRATSAEWVRFIKLDAYGALRRWLLAHGKNVEWRSFSGWFPMVPQQFRGSNRSLLHAMYRLRGKRTPADAYVPAIEVPALVAFELARDAWAATRNLDGFTGCITPDTVLLMQDSFQHLNNSRRAMVPAHEDEALSEELRDQSTYQIDVDRHVVRPLATMLETAFSQGRRWVTKRPSTNALVHRVAGLAPTSRAPHPLFLLPLVLFETSPSPIVLYHWQSAILLLWMLDGGEEVLDRLYRLAPWHPPLSDRDDLRSRYVLPEHMWLFMERALGSIRMRAPRDSDAVRADLKLWRNAVREDPKAALKLSNVIFNDTGDWHVVPARQRRELRGEQLTEELRVRMIQAVRYPEWPAPRGLVLWAESMADIPSRVRRKTLEPVSTELADRLIEARSLVRLVSTKPLSQGPSLQANRQIADKGTERKAAVQEKQTEASGGRKPDHLLIFPEWYAPRQQVRQLRQFVRETGIAILTGMMIREIPRAVHVCDTAHLKGPRLLVNEALLLLPDQQPLSSSKQSDTMPTRVHSFWIRKPFPAPNERAMIRHLNSRSGHSVWGFLGGLQWHRWSYRDWGSFSVAICSDLLDTYAWDWLRGNIQHLFITAWNTDIDLFDQITWTRGFELYANVVTVNHGSEGGSVAWTPKGGHDKEVFRVHGPNQGLAVTVNLPVRDLVTAQQKGLEWGVNRAYEFWSTPHSEKPIERQYKSPAPNFRFEP